MEEEIVGNDTRSKLNFALTWGLMSVFEVCSLSILSVFGIAMNVLIFVMYFSKHSLRSSANTIVLSLAASNLLRCVFLMPFFFITLKRWMSGEIWCKSFNTLSLCLNLVSVLSVLLIAFDRNCAIKAPLQYILHNSKKRVGLLVLYVWILSITLAVPVLFGVLELDYETCEIKASSKEFIFNVNVIYECTITLIAFIVPFLCVASLHFSMFRAAHKNISGADMDSWSSSMSRDVVVYMKSPKNPGENEYSLRRHFRTGAGQNSQKKRLLMKKYRAVATGLLVVLSFTICWSPYFIVRFYQQFQMVTIQSKFWVYFATLLSSIFDPYVYFYRNRSTWIYTKKQASRIFNRKKSLKPIPMKIKSRILDISNVYRLLASINQTVLTSKTSEQNAAQTLNIEENNKGHTMLYEEDALQDENDMYSMFRMKTFIHQDSSSSKCSSDGCVTVVSIEIPETVSYQSFQKSQSEESTFERH